MPVSFSPAHRTRAKRGLGSHVRFANDDADWFGRGVSRGAKHAVLAWVLFDDEVIVPGAGGVPNGVVAMLWESHQDDQYASVYYDRPTRTGFGSVAAVEGFTVGRLHVFYRGYGAAG